jgi:hypothetical protein
MKPTSNLVAVMMPFSPRFDTVYQQVIRPAVETVGLRPLRADDERTPGKIMDRVYQMIRCSSVVIADLTGLNRNVIYEVGLAHALHRPVILLTQTVTKLTFDIQHLRVLPYSAHARHFPAMRQKLARALREVASGQTPTAFLAFTDAKPLLSRAAMALATYQLAKDVHELRYELPFGIILEPNVDTYVATLCARIDAKLALLQFNLNAPNWLHLASERERYAVGEAFFGTIDSLLKVRGKSLHARYDLGTLVSLLKTPETIKFGSDGHSLIFKERLPSAAHYSELPRMFVDGIVQSVERCWKQRTPERITSALADYIKRLDLRIESELAALPELAVKEVS